MYKKSAWEQNVKLHGTVCLEAQRPPDRLPTLRRDSRHLDLLDEHCVRKICITEIDRRIAEKQSEESHQVLSPVSCYVSRSLASKLPCASVLLFKRKINHVPHHLSLNKNPGKFLPISPPLHLSFSQLLRKIEILLGLITNVPPIIEDKMKPPLFGIRRLLLDFCAVFQSWE